MQEIINFLKEPIHLIYVTLAITGIATVIFIAVTNLRYWSEKKETDKEEVKKEEKEFAVETIISGVMVVAFVAQLIGVLYLNNMLPFISGDSKRQGVITFVDVDVPPTDVPEDVPALLSEITDGISAPVDSAELTALGALTDPSSTNELTDARASGTTTPWKTTTSATTYQSGKYWKSASVTARSSCTLGYFKATTQKQLSIGQHKVTFENGNNTAVNYTLLLPDYIVNAGGTNYTHPEEHIPGFYTRSNNLDYTFKGDTKSADQGYTAYTAKLFGYYLYKKTVTLPNGSISYKFYRIACGGKTIGGIKSYKPVNGGALKEKAITQLGHIENPVGSNCGSAIKPYLNAVGLSCGEPWCAAFVSWVWQNTSLGLAAKPQLSEVGASQMLARLKESGFKRYVVVKTVSAGGWNFSAGDILIRDPGQSTGHVGMVTSYNAKDKVLHTIEGNSSDQVIRHTYCSSCSNGTIGGKWDYYGHWLKQ